MALFEGVEADLTAFFVAQGSVFDTLVRSLMERLAQVESHVETLRVDVASSFQSLSLEQQLMQQHLQHQQQLLLSGIASQSVHEEPQPPPPASEEVPTTAAAVVVDPQPVEPGDGREELEYYVLTLSRQLNVVLELVFQPHALDAAAGIQSKQARFESISDVLTDNETILMQLAAQEPPSAAAAIELLEKTVELKEEVPTESPPELAAQELEYVDANHEKEADPNPADAFAPIESPLDVHHEEEEEDDVENQTPREPIASETETLPQTKKHHNRRRRGPERHQSAPPSAEPRKSLFNAFHAMSEAEANRSREQQLRDAELLRQMKLMLQNATQDWNQQWNDQVFSQQELQLKLQSEWQALQQQQQNDLLDQFRRLEQSQLEQSQSQQLQQLEKQHDLEQKLQQLNDSCLSFKSLLDKEAERTREGMDDLRAQLVTRDELNSLISIWFQAARDDCVFGVSTDALTALRDEFLALQDTLEREPELQPTLAALLEEIRRVLELLESLLALLGGSDSTGGLHTAQGSQLMQMLRTMLATVDDLAQNVLQDHEAGIKSAAFVAESIRQMELGTASLLEALELQQERVEGAFSLQQKLMDRLQSELKQQQQVDLELRRQMAGCPSQEETLRLVQGLQEEVNDLFIVCPPASLSLITLNQIHATATDSNAKLLETVDELRGKMTGLPTADVINSLARALQTKADRSEMERLQTYSVCSALLWCEGMLTLCCVGYSPTLQQLQLPTLAPQSHWDPWSRCPCAVCAAIRRFQPPRSAVGRRPQTPDSRCSTSTSSWHRSRTTHWIMGL